MKTAQCRIYPVVHASPCRKGEVDDQPPLPRLVALRNKSEPVHVNDLSDSRSDRPKHSPISQLRRQEVGYHVGSHLSRLHIGACTSTLERPVPETNTEAMAKTLYQVVTVRDVGVVCQGHLPYCGCHGRLNMRPPRFCKEPGPRVPRPFAVQS